jgi:hypothetical protein
MAEQIPYYAKNLQDSLNGMYGHNILEAGETSPAGRLYSAITATAGSTVAYDRYTPIASDGDDSVTGLALSAREKIITGAIHNISVTGLGAKLIANILEI